MSNFSYLSAKPEYSLFAPAASRKACWNRRTPSWKPCADR